MHGYKMYVKCNVIKSYESLTELCDNDIIIIHSNHKVGGYAMYARNYSSKYHIIDTNDIG